MNRLKLIITYYLWWIGLAAISMTGSIDVSMAAWRSPLAPLESYRRICHNVRRWSLFCLDIREDNPLVLPENTHFIITVNHQSFDDIPLVMALLASHHIYPRFIMKDAILRIPCIGNICKKMSFLAIQRNQPRQILRQITESAKQPSLLDSWLLFPEGTRAPLGMIHPAKSAGLAWLLSAYPNHQWLDLTIIYRYDHVQIQFTQLARPDRNALELALVELWQSKQNLGLLATESNHG